MSKHKKHSEKHTVFHVFENTKKTELGRNKFKLGQQLSHLNGLHIIVGISQMVFGSIIILISVTGFIQPLWLSTLLSVVSSIAIIIGVYFCYSSLSALRTDTLLREAMRRIMEAQN